MDKKKARGYGGVEPFSRIRKELVKEVRGQPRPRMPAPVRARQRRDALPGAGHAKCVGEASRGARGQRERACVGWQPRERGHVPQSQAGRSPVQLRARVPAQVRALAPSDRVLVLGCSAEPHAAVTGSAPAAPATTHRLLPHRSATRKGRARGLWRGTPEAPAWLRQQSSQCQLSPAAGVRYSRRVTTHRSRLSRERAPSAAG